MTKANENAKKAKGKSDSDHKSTMRNVIEESPTTKPKEKDKKSQKKKRSFSGFLKDKFFPKNKSSH